MGEDFADDVSFQATDNLAVALSFFLAFADIGQRGRVVAHPNDCDPIERGVGLSVATTIESMPVLTPR